MVALGYVFTLMVLLPSIIYVLHAHLCSLDCYISTCWELHCVREKTVAWEVLKGVVSVWCLGSVALGSMLKSWLYASDGLLYFFSFFLFFLGHDHACQQSVYLLFLLLDIVLGCRLYRLCHINCLIKRVIHNIRLKIDFVSISHWYSRIEKLLRKYQYGLKYFMSRPPYYLVKWFPHVMAGELSQLQAKFSWQRWWWFKADEPNRACCWLYCKWWFNKCTDS